MQRQHSSNTQAAAQQATSTQVVVWFCLSQAQKQKRSKSAPKEAGSTSTNGRFIIEKMYGIFAWFGPSQAVERTHILKNPKPGGHLSNQVCDFLQCLKKMASRVLSMLQSILRQDCN